MHSAVKLANILTRLWLIVCVAMFIYQVSYIPKFYRSTSYEARDEIYTSTTKIIDDLYIEKYGMKAAKYRWLKGERGEVSIPKEKINTLNSKIKITIWTKNIFVSLIKNIFLFIAASTTFFLTIRILPVWLIYGGWPSLKYDAGLFPINVFIKAKTYFLSTEKNYDEINDQ